MARAQCRVEGEYRTNIESADKAGLCKGTENTKQRALAGPQATQAETERPVSFAVRRVCT
jgi:hypothetical protein